MKNLCFYAFIALFVSIKASGASPDSSNYQIHSPLKIGIKVSPPFVIASGNDFDGISIAFWHLINEDHHFDYEFVPYDNIASLLTAVEKGEVDFSINPITVSDQRMKTISFSQPYYITETAVARKNDSKFVTLFRNIVSWKFFSAIAILLSVIFVFGFLVWIFERKRNAEQFGGTLKGLAQGFWWSAVTMTTVGYGDKAPQTTAGRIVGFIWMFTAIILISGLTASIASSLTVQSIHETIDTTQDLQKFKVISIKGSNSDKYLGLYNIKRVAVDDVEFGLKQLLKRKAEVLVYDKPILKYYVRNNDWTDKIAILEKGLKTDYYSFSFPKNSPMLPRINPTLIAKLRTPEWQRILDKFQ